MSFKITKRIEFLSRKYEQYHINPFIFWREQNRSSRPKKIESNILFVSSLIIVDCLFHCREAHLPTTK